MASSSSSSVVPSIAQRPSVQPDSTYAQTTAIVFRRTLSSINYEPITIKGLTLSNPRLFCIYMMEDNKDPNFVAVAEKTDKMGTALGAIYEEENEHSQWMGKVGAPTGFLRDDPDTLRRRKTSQMEINLDTIREKIAYDLYQELGRGLFQVPRNCLSPQKIWNSYTLRSHLAQAWVSMGINESLWIMSRFVDGYNDLAKAETLNGSARISFMEFIRKQHRPPESVLNPNGDLVPLLGIIELFTIGKVLADTDFLGGHGTNCGFIWVEDQNQKIIAARAVKIDPGCAFQFKLQAGDEVSQNRLINAREKLGNPHYWLTDQRDIQTSNNDSTTTISWEKLTDSQQNIFLSTLMNVLRYKNNPKVLELLFYRGGKFYRNDLEQIPLDIAKRFIQEMTQWIDIQKEIYTEDLKAFHQAHSEELLRIQYIDRYGELSLPASDQTFPIRELFIQLTIIETKSAHGIVKTSQPELPERDSLIETQERMNLSSPSIALETLFDERNGQSAPRKVILLGRAGIGKSTLCQKISHDWASGRLWSDRYKAIYWIPLRDLNSAVEEGGFLFQEMDPDRFLAKAVAHLRFQNPDLAGSLLAQLQNHRHEILVLLDGWDEASPSLIQALNPLLQHPESILLLASRPGITEPLHQHVDLIVENIGFSKEHISQYAHNFFHRGEIKTELAKAREEKFLTTLEKEKNLSTIAHIPLVLQMLCIQWELGTEHTGFAPTLTGIYSDMIDELFRWQCRREGTDPYAISGLAKKEILSVLGDVALGGLREGKLIIPGQFVQNILQSTRISERELLRTGLLRATGEGTAREYSFLHLTFQEYMIAFGIAQKSSTEQKSFIVEHRCKPQFQLVLALMAGIIDSQDPTKEKLKRFFDHLYTAPGDLTGFYQLALTLRCLQQCSDSIIQDWVEKKNRVYSTLLSILKLSPNEGATEELFRWVSSCTDYLKGSEKCIEQIITALCSNGLNLFILKSELIEKLISERWYRVFEDCRQVLKDSKNSHIRSQVVRGLQMLCQKVPSDEQWLKAFEVFRQDFKVSVPNVQTSAALGLCSLAERCPIKHWYALSEALFKLLAYSERDVPRDAANALADLCKKCPPERWYEIFKVFYADTTNSIMTGALICDHCLNSPLEGWDKAFRILQQDFRDPSKTSRVISALWALCHKSPPERWYVVFEFLFQSLGDVHTTVQSIAEEVLSGLYSNIPLEQRNQFSTALYRALQDPRRKTRCIGMLENFLKRYPSEWRFEVFEYFRQALEDKNDNIREKVIFSLWNLCYKIPSEFWNEAFVTFQRVFKDPASSVRYNAITGVGILCHTISSQQWYGAFNALKPFLMDPDENIRKNSIWAMSNLSKKCPPEHWDEVFAALLPFLKEIVISSDASTAIEVLYAKVPSADWEKAFNVLNFVLAHDQIREKSIRNLIENGSLEQREKVFRFLFQVLDKSHLRAQIIGVCVLCYYPSEVRAFEKWNKFFEVIGRAVKEKDRFLPMRSNFVYQALEELSANISSEQWHRAFEALSRALRGSDREVRKRVSQVILELCNRNPPKLTPEAVEILHRALADTDTEVRKNGLLVMISLYKKASSRELSEAFELLHRGLADADTEVRKNRLLVLISLYKKASSREWSETFKILRQGINDKEKDIRIIAARELSFFFTNPLSELWHEAFEVFSLALDDQEFEVRQTGLDAIQCCSLSVLTHYLQCTPKYLNIYFSQVGLRKSPLYINRLPNHQLQLACIENNREVTREISEEEYEQIKLVLLKNHILKSYVAQYMDREDPRLNLDLIDQWLNKKFPGKWQTQGEEEGVLIESLEGDKTSLSSVRLELVHLADSLELETLQISRENRRLSIKGKPEEIETLFNNLKAS